MYVYSKVSKSVNSHLHLCLFLGNSMFPIPTPPLSINSDKSTQKKGLMNSKWNKQKERLAFPLQTLSSKTDMK